MTLLDLLASRAPSPTLPRIGDAAPLLAIGWMTLGGALAHAGWLGLPGSAAWGVVLAAARAGRAGRPAPDGPAPVSGRVGPGAGRRSRSLGAVHAAVNVALLRRPPADPPPVRRPVTVVLPVRDEEEQVGGCLAALLDQRGVDDLRVVVVDDGSTDGTADVVRAVRRPPGPAGDRRPAPAGLARQAARLRGRGGRRRRAGRRGPRRSSTPTCGCSPTPLAGAVAVLDGTGLDLVSPWPRPLAARAGRAAGAAARAVAVGDDAARCGSPSARRGRRWPRRPGSSWCSTGAATTGPAATPRSAARCSRTSRCCGR